MVASSLALFLAVLPAQRRNRRLEDPVRRGIYPAESVLEAVHFPGSQQV